MKREMNGKIAMLAAVVMLCFTGCGMESPTQAESTIGSENPADVEKMEEMENVEEVESIIQEQETETDSAEQNIAQTDLDVAQMLEDAEREASALQKKLMEDPSLTQADMNMLSMEIYQVWDGVLNDLWKALKNTLEEERMDSLLQEQRAWITEKEAEVKEAGEAVGGGSMAPLVANQRAAQITRKRVYELASYLGFTDGSIGNLT